MSVRQIVRQKLPLLIAEWQEHSTISSPLACGKRTSPFCENPTCCRPNTRVHPHERP
jgi:hypothetical protein